MHWFNRNKEWFLSGVGVTIIIALCTWWTSNGETQEQISTANQTQIIHGGQGIQAGRDVYINQIQEKDKKLVEDIIKRLSPDNIRSKSIKLVERELGTPVEESADSKTFVKDGYRISISDFIDDKSYRTISIGPVETALSTDLPKIQIGGVWGEFKKGFGYLTVGDVIDSYGSCEISDWNMGANGRCMNLFELQCAGSNAQNNLYLRAGVDSCYYSTEIEDQASAVLGHNPNIDTDNHESLYSKEVRATKVNYIEISEIKKKCPRASGGCD